MADDKPDVNTLLRQAAGRMPPTEPEPPAKPVPPRSGGDPHTGTMHPPKGPTMNDVLRAAGRGFHPRR